jgi:hypothetical protein
MPSSAFPNAPTIAFGTANFGSAPSNGAFFGPVTVEDGMGYLKVLQQYGVSVPDTARVYVRPCLIITHRR